VTSNASRSQNHGLVKLLAAGIVVLLCYAVAITVKAFSTKHLVVKLPKDTQWATVYVALGSALVSLIAIIASTSVAVWSQRRTEVARERDRVQTDAKERRDQAQRTPAPVLQFLTHSDPSSFWNPSVMTMRAKMSLKKTGNGCWTRTRRLSQPSIKVGMLAKPTCSH
jgi:hypothetical protein